MPSVLAWIDHDSKTRERTLRILSIFQEKESNMPETIAMLRGSGEDTYWRLTLQYGIDGNPQSVLDEYVHVLRESLGLQEHSPEELGGWHCGVHPRTAKRVGKLKLLKQGLALYWMVFRSTPLVVPAVQP